MPAHRCGLVGKCGHHSLRNGTEAVGMDVFNSGGVGGREEGSSCETRTFRLERGVGAGKGDRAAHKAL